MSLDPAVGPLSLRPPSPINVYRARRPKKRWTVWRVIRWTLGLIVLAVAFASAAVAYFAWDRLHALTTTSDPEVKLATKALVPVNTATQPAIALILGYDTRYGEHQNGHSDTLILVRIDPRTKMLSTLALPRDLQVPIKGIGVTKINEAYARGGPKLAIETVSAFIKTPIAYYIPVNFKAFRLTVDAVHGVYVDVDRRYYHTNDGLSSSSANYYSQINLQAGYQRLSGGQALTYVRNRHNDSDFMRNARQQAFLREFKRRLDVGSLGTSIPTLVTDLSDNIKILSKPGHALGFRQLGGYAKLLSSIPRRNLVQVKVEGRSYTNSAGASVVSATALDVQQKVQAFLHPNPNAADKIGGRVGGKQVGGPAKPKTGVVPIPADKLKVVTINGSGQAGIASVSAAALRSGGWKQAATIGGNAIKPTFTSTAIYYATARAKAATARLRLTLGDTLDPQPMPRNRATISADADQATLAAADVVVVIGSSYNGVSTLPDQPTPDQTYVPAPPKTQPARASDIAFFRAFQKRLGYQARYPTRVPVGSVYGEPIEVGDNPFRVYTLRKRKAGHVTARTALDTSHAWGIQYTLWTDAPILDEPSKSYCLKDGRLIRLYANGSQVHRIAVYYGGARCKADGVVAWISNSLDNRLTPDTMIAVAKSLRPLPAQAKTPVN